MFMYQAPQVFALIMSISSFICLLRTVVQANICSQQYFQNVKMWRMLMQTGMCEYLNSRCFFLSPAEVKDQNEREHSTLKKEGGH